MIDLISRKAVLEEIQKIECEPGYQHVGEDWAVGLNIAESIVTSAESIESTPSVKPEPEWIPVTEALPADMDRLLATIIRSNGEKRVRSGHYYKGYFMMDNGDTWNETDKEILAWMPLPKPYRGE